MGIQVNGVSRDEVTKAVVNRDVTALEEYKARKAKQREQAVIKDKLNTLERRIAQLEKLLGVDSGTA